MNPRPRKRFAQHWLKSEIALHQIVEAAKLKSSDRLLEIGPGTGILTKLLLPSVSKLLAVEIDRDLCKKLVKNFGNQDNFLLLEGDFLELNLEELLANFPDFKNYNKVVANIPYHITGPIIQKLLGTISQPSPTPQELIVLLVQKEVGDRLVAIPGSKAFGALSVRVQYLADCEIICNVPAKSFYPPPKVDSVVVRLRPRPLENSATNPRLLETLIKLGFASRRKMLKNNLKSLIEPENLTQLLIKLNLNPQTRAENLSLPQWIILSNSLNPRIFRYDRNN
jgi:16S rRNA (adenine1518-N6/adenine1519-N6)-dimethyltransferase